MEIRKCPIPSDSCLVTAGQRYDYTDCFEGEFRDAAGQVGPAEMGRAFFSSGPRWVGRLFALRNAIVKPLGLKTSGGTQQELEQYRFDPGERLGLFQVTARTDRELVLGEDDRHLDFRVSLFLAEGPAPGTRRLCISTTVRYHNVRGRLYFMPTGLFHRRIVPSMLRGMLARLDQQPQG